MYVCSMWVSLHGTIFFIIQRKLLREDQEDSEDPVEVTTIEEIENCGKDNPDAPPQLPTKEEETVRETET